MFSFGPNVANFLEMSPSVRKTLKFMSNAVISSLRPNIKKVTSQNHGNKNVFSPKSKIKFSVLSGGLAQIANSRSRATVCMKNNHTSHRVQDPSLIRILSQHRGPSCYVCIIV